MSDGKFKRVDRARRDLVKDGSFSKGMYFTRNLVDSQTSRLLLNMTLRDNGASLSPRMGIGMDKNKLIRTLDRPFTSKTHVPAPHAKYFGVYRDSSGLDKFGQILVSFGVPSHPEYEYYYTADEVDEQYYEQVYRNDGTAFGFLTDSTGKLHPINMDALGDTRLRFYDKTVKPLYTVFNNKAYIIDGTAQETTETEVYNVSGEFQRHNDIPYNGKLTSMKIEPKDKDVDVVVITTLDAKGTENGSISLPLPLRYMPSADVRDSYQYSTAALTQRIGYLLMDSLLAEMEIIQGEYVDIVKIPKPTDSFVSGKVTEEAFRKVEISGLVEVNVTEQTVLDSSLNINTYSSRVDAGFIYMAIAKGYDESGIQDMFVNTDFKYVLQEPYDYPVDQSEDLQLVRNGYISFYSLGNMFPIDVEYSAEYQQPIATYSGGLIELNVIQKEDGYHLDPKPVEAKTVLISEATSVGFNMLHANPYSFQNTEGNVLRAMGIMPYKPESNKEILMSANLGEEIEFEVIYDYVKGTNYTVKWEYMGIGVGEIEPVATVLEEYGVSTYKGGTRIAKVIKANDKRFSLRVTIAPIKSDGTTDTLLEKVTIYPVYETGNDQLRDISSYKYNLHNATGLGSYKTMLCLWGVPGAETTLFFSDFGDPSYFPFASHIVSFDYKILDIQNYQSGLLVFTTNGIYLIEGEDPAEFIITNLYQNLTFDKEDMESLKVVKNAIFVRSGKNYYTLVPNTYTGEMSDIRLTNITDPIKEILDDWKAFLEFLGTYVFNWDLKYTYKMEVKQYDFFNYVDNSNIKNVYRFAVYEPIGEQFNRYQIDVVLVYNTNKGTWTVETMNLPYNGFIAEGGTLHTTYGREIGKDMTRIYYQSLKFKRSNRQDFYNTSRFGDSSNDRHVSTREAELQELPDIIHDTVVRVIDGDTIELEQLGTFRFLYVNAPEYTTTHEPFGKETSEFIKNMLPEGTEVRIEFEGDRSDIYDRTLGWLFKDDELVQLKLAEFGGVASVYDYGTSKYAEVLDAAIETAVKNKVGMWEFTEGSPEYIYSSDTEHLEPNYQVLDTGNKNHDPYLQKRFREFQFQIMNHSEDSIKFYNRFYVEGIPKQDFREYEIIHNTDRASEEYGHLEVIPIDTPNSEVQAATFLNTWTLGVNMLPDIDMVKVRFQVSGKGRYCRMLMISKNEANYDLLSYAWVMRAMNYK